MTSIRTRCQIWRSDGFFKTTEGELATTSDNELVFVVAEETRWHVPFAEVVWKHPWYTGKAALRITEPEVARGLFMAYSPRNKGGVGNAIDTARARTALRPIIDRLARARSTS